MLSVELRTDIRLLLLTNGRLSLVHVYFMSLGFPMAVTETTNGSPSIPINSWGSIEENIGLSANQKQFFNRAAGFFRKGIDRLLPLTHSIYIAFMLLPGGLPLSVQSC